MDLSRNPNPNPKRSLDDLSVDGPLSKRPRPEDLLELLDQEGDTTAGEPTAIGERDLESIISSLEEEIAREGELGFLLHASDDELGLPPPCEAAATEATEAEVREEVAEVNVEVVEKFADVDGGVDSGLFGWCDEGLYGPLDLSDLTWQPQMPAV